MIELNPKYKKLYSTKKRYILVTGGRGSGKTFAVQDFLIRLLEQPNQGILYTRYTMTSVDKTIIPLFLKHIDLISNPALYHITKTRIINKKTGSFIMFSGIKTSSGDQTGNLKSLPDITTWVIEEGEDFNNENSFTDIDDSIRSKEIQNRIIWIQNPTTRNHFIYKRFFKSTHKKETICSDAFYIDNDNNKQLSTFQRSTHENVEHIHTTYEDNKENLNPNKVKQWDKVKIKDPKKWANKYGGAWIDMPEGVIFEHVNWIKEFPKHITKLSYGMDFGFNDPTTLVVCGVSDGELFAQRLIYSSGMITKDIDSTLKELNFNRNHRIYADSADPKTIKTLRSIYKWDVKGAKKGQDSIIEGINAVKSYDKLNIVDCKFWKEEQIGYIWAKDRKDESLLDKPKAADKDNHLWDALRYSIQGLRRTTAKTRVR
jgi:phage terminase large subunit